MIDDIMIFVKVVEENSLGKAAKLLNIRVSTVSKHLADLENRLKKQLFIRDTRNIKITDYGQFLYDRFKHLPAYLSDTISINNLNNNVNTSSGELNISLATAISYELITPYLEEFAQLNPLIKLNINFTPHINQWPSEYTDIVLAINSINDKNLDNRYIKSDYIRLYCRAEYALKYGIPLEPHELSLNHRYLGGLDVNNKPLNYVILKNLKDNSEFVMDSSTAQIKLNNHLHIKRIGANADFIFGSLDSLCYKEVINGTFIPILPEWIIYKNDYYLITKKKTGPVEQSFIDFIYRCMSISYNKIVSEK